MMIKRILISVSLLILASCSSSPVDELDPFTSDGCSSFPDGTLKQKQLWLSCCVAHDKSYWVGGSYQQRVDADNELEACVEKVGEKAIAKLMLAGVRVGGSPYWPTSFRWGYGWDYPRGYQELTEEETAHARNLLKAYELSQQPVKQEEQKVD